jgi:methylated-DNA-[protein]-cysteine S-methyltransferase
MQAYAQAAAAPATHSGRSATNRQDQPDAFHDLYYDTVDSPLGPLFVGGSAAGVQHLAFLTGGGAQAESGALRDREAGPPGERDAAAASLVVAQLGEYFAGERERFDLPLAASGTEFQRRVWEALRRVPYGRTASYGEIARAIGRPSAARAVGAASRSNPLAIVVPCHRIVGADGALTGYGGGLERKAWLLEQEARNWGADAGA